VVADLSGAGYGEAGGGNDRRGGCVKLASDDWPAFLNSGVVVEMERGGFLCTPVQLGSFMVFDPGCDGGEFLSAIRFDGVEPENSGSGILRI